MRRSGCGTIRGKGVRSVGFPTTFPSWPPSAADSSSAVEVEEPSRGRFSGGAPGASPDGAAAWPTGAYSGSAFRLPIAAGPARSTIGMTVLARLQRPARRRSRKGFTCLSHGVTCQQCDQRCVPPPQRSQYGPLTNNPQGSAKFREDRAAWYESVTGESLHGVDLAQQWRRVHRVARAFRADTRHGRPGTSRSVGPRAGDLDEYADE